MKKLSDQNLQDLGAKYVFYLEDDVLFFKREQSTTDIVVGFVISKGTVCWTKMEVDGAPSNAVIPVFTLVENLIIRLQVNFSNLKVLKKF